MAQIRKAYRELGGVKLDDIMAKHPDVFRPHGDGTVELVSEPRCPSWVEDTSVGLPCRIAAPVRMQEKIQALRIEIIYALSKREGHRCQVNDLGKEPLVGKAKQGIFQAQKITDFVKIFPRNFRLVTHPEDGSPAEVELVSIDVEDESMIVASIARNTESFRSKGKGKGGPGAQRGPFVAIPEQTPVSELHSWPAGGKGEPAMPTTAAGYLRYAAQYSAALEEAKSTGRV